MTHRLVWYFTRSSQICCKYYGHARYHVSRRWSDCLQYPIYGLYYLLLVTGVVFLQSKEITSEKSRMTFWKSIWKTDDPPLPSYYISSESSHNDEGGLSMNTSHLSPGTLFSRTKSKSQVGLKLTDQMGSSPTGRRPGMIYSMIFLS